MELWGNLTLEAFKHDFIQSGANASAVVGALGLLIFLTVTKRWTWLWKEWLTSLDPKKIGVMYLTVAGIMLFKGLMDAALMRAQQAVAVAPDGGILTADHFQQIFSAHGTTMIFFVAMGALFGIVNLIVPLQIGARDVAFPFMNALSFWFFASGAMLVMISLLIGKFSATGWLAYPPLSGIEYNPGEGVDYWIWMLQIAGVGSLMSGINFLVTILKMRCPGMTLMKMPIFIWTIIGAMVLVIFAFPILTATLTMLSLDRYLGMHFFTSSSGGNPMMYVNLIWAWGHPEVYILIFPAFGIYSEIVATFSRKRIFNYASMVVAVIAIIILSFIVWLHHFFTMGAEPKVNAFFGIMTILIAVPTGVKIFNWIFTMFQGRIHLATPMYWFLCFVFIFTIGGMAGVLLSIPPIDFQVHNSLFLIAHFHSVIIGGVLFGFFAGLTYWFPKIFGFKLNEEIGKWSCWLWVVGFLLAFMPLYLLGFMGATRRLDQYLDDLGWQPLFIIAASGLMLIVSGLALQFWQIYVSIKERKQNLDTTGDPWHGRTLEWATSSPPPHYNFAQIPVVEARDPLWVSKQGGALHFLPPAPFKMPRNSWVAVVVGQFGTSLCFALTWHIWWLAALSFIAMIGGLVFRFCQPDEAIEELITAEAH